MHNDIILEKIIQMFSAMTEAENITPESELMEDLAISSMDILYLVSCLEEEFNIKIPESGIRRMFTIGGRSRSCLRTETEKCLITGASPDGQN